ncbi:hypothetical protein ACFSX9_09815 [Flavobacterium ardleyense]|uniref:Uncharacterized protein n=1 Tax=Flavobacterium ardleyense TaxID=2038737 RepID=A0ABW5ZA93_9FLAO
MKAFLILISFLFLSNSDVLHKDTSLQLEKNGNIVGLPKSFSPANFDINKKKLRLNNKEIVFPNCVKFYFDEQKNSKLDLSASWYHSKETMPYYLIFNIENKKGSKGYKILVDLETLDLIYVQKSKTRGITTYNENIELDEKCLNEYKDNIKTIN